MGADGLHDTYEQISVWAAEVLSLEHLIQQNIATDEDKQRLARLRALLNNSKTTGQMVDPDASKGQGDESDKRE